MTDEPKASEFYPRARKDWDSIELERLRLLIPYDYNWTEMVDFFGRPKANIERTVKEMKTVLDPSYWPKVTAAQIMLKPVLPRYGAYSWRAPLGELFPALMPKPILVEVAEENKRAAESHMDVLTDIENGGKKVKRL